MKICLCSLQYATLNNLRNTGINTHSVICGNPEEDRKILVLNEKEKKIEKSIRTFYFTNLQDYIVDSDNINSIARNYLKKYHRCYIFIIRRVFKLIN